MFGFIPYKKHTTFCRSIAAQRKTRNLHDYGFFSFMSMGYEKDGFVFLIDGFEPPKLTNLSHSIQHCPEANHPNNE